MPILTIQRKKQRNLIIVLALVVVASTWVLYSGLFSREPQEFLFIGEGVDILRGTEEVKLNLKLLGEDRFRSLVPYEKISGDINTGRDNPFAPYNIESNMVNVTSTNL